MAVAGRFNFDEDQLTSDPFNLRDADELLYGPEPNESVSETTRRLWRPLAYQPRQPLELEEIDKVGDRFIGIIQRVFRSKRAIRQRARKVVALSDSFRDLGEKRLDEEIEKAREGARRGNRDLDVRSHAFAVVRETMRRVIGLSLYEEQVMGGWVMEDNCIAEMATGEGKTITACLTASVQGWMGYGVHVITVNDYLARRDADINHKVYKRLGLSVGVIQDESEDDDRREAYRSDVTYTTDKQLVFDFLRDRLRSPTQPRVTSLLLEELSETGVFTSGSPWTETLVLRGLHAAVIDEADSVLIDEASTPAIIGGPGGEDVSSEYYGEAAKIARFLKEDTHFTIDRAQHRVDLTDDGRDQLEELADRLPPFWSGPLRREELVNQALTASYLYSLDDEYIVRDDDIQIVDPGTGRVLEGRQWQMGLHQAVQAKEGLQITAPNETLARISYQRFYQRYKKLCGMTGTAWEVRHEMWRSYQIPVVRIPTHRPLRRKQGADRVYPDRKRKFEAIADETQKLHEARRPVLIGTRSVEASEGLSELLNERGVPHRVLNAVRHEEEAATISQAGKPGAVTVATNMAGRGTDIILDKGIIEKGGLVVLATERHDTYRIDRQLYGRSGRQGDPGRSQAYVALDDALIQVSGIRWITQLLKRFPLLRGTPVSRLHWYIAQNLADRRGATSREISAQNDLWFDRALHFENK